MKTWTCFSALAAGIFAAANLCAAESSVLETPGVRFSLTPETGRYEILDKAASVVWRSNPWRERFGEVALWSGGKLQPFSLAACKATRVGAGLELAFQPISDKPAGILRVRIAPTQDGRTLEFSYEASDLSVESVRLLDDALWLTDTTHDYAAVPVREGLLVPADSGLAFTQRFGTFEYEGCHMEMLGLVKNGAAALLTWHDPYVVAELKSALTNAASANAKQVLSPSLVLRKSAKSFRLQFLGRGDYVSIANAYRPIANAKGWRVTWKEKLASHPERAKLFGAVNYKLWSTLSRSMSDDSKTEERVSLNWTFDEAAQIAEHLKNDLKLDKVLFMIGGWIHRGYDNQHPDILPSAPECGGDAAFADCARRVMRLGYTFCLHDNYQDIYRDSPSWNEDFIMKTPDGQLTKGGKWAGGRAYLTCSQKAVELAKRPQNLTAVKKLTGADSYFIDTTYAAGLQECFDKNHPLTKWDDMKWKQAISDYAREVFGIFGSECGREWAIPHADFFEGLTGVSGTYYHNKDLAKNVGGSVIPLFEMVYRDTVAMYGKYGYDFNQAAGYVLHHIAIGRPLHYHSIPSHLYWKRGDAPRRGETREASPAAVFTRGDNGWGADLHRVDRFVKNTYEILSPLYELTAQALVTEHQFLTPDRKVQRTVFGQGDLAVVAVVNASATEYRHPSKLGGDVVLPPYGFVIESPTFVAFHASTWSGLTYADPPLFTLRSLDGQPLSRAQHLRIYHGFGDARINMEDKVRTVTAETVE